MDFGLVSVLDPESLDARNLGQQTVKLLEADPPPTPAELGIPFNGGERFAARVEKLLRNRTSLKKATAFEARN